MLRDAVMEPEVSPNFDDRLLRKLRVVTTKESMTYWSPALFGAGIAFVAIFAALQIAATPAQLSKAKLPGGEARLERNVNSIPSLLLNEKPTIDR